MPAVVRLALTPVKGLALHHPPEVFLGPAGVLENRRFYLTDGDGRLLNGKRHGPLALVRADYDAAGGSLALRFPDGAVVDGAVPGGEPVETSFYGRPVTGRIVAGPFAEALAAYAGEPVRLILADRPGEACDRHPVTLLSTASVEELHRRSGRRLDTRRFRMLVELAGCEPHEEDAWAGREVRLGGALVRVLGPVPRCVVTTHHPDTGQADFDTLGAITAYRGPWGPDGKAVFGVAAEVLEPGRVALGDPASPL